MSINGVDYIKHEGWTCPECGSTDLLINVQTVAQLVQIKDGCLTYIHVAPMNYAYEWGNDSYTECHDCGFSGSASDFSNLKE